MKQTLLLVLLFIGINAAAQGVAVNNDNTTAHPTAMLDVKSTSRGVLIPRMTTVQRLAIEAPATGLIVFDLDKGRLYCFAGAEWVETLAGFVSIVEDADGDTKIEVEENADDDTIRFVVSGLEVAKLDGRSFHLEAPGSSVFIGKGAGMNDDGSSNRNIAIGSRSLAQNSFGNDNVAIGYQSQYDNQFGFGNCTLGNNSLQINENGYRNTAIGSGSLQMNVSSGNTAVGFESLKNNFGGTDNTAIGVWSMLDNSGNNNTAVGTESLFSNLFGNDNTAIGYHALQANNSGSGNAALGALGLANNIDGVRNTAVGFGSLINNESGEENVAIGYGAALTNTNGHLNVSIGSEALRQNSTGIGNVAIGFQAGANTTGDHGVFLGYQAGLSETTGAKLYIDNSSTSSPLLYGDFSTDELEVNGTLSIGIGTHDARLVINSETAEDPLRVRVNGTTRFMVHDNGGISVGTTTSPPALGAYLLGNAYVAADMGVGVTSPSAKLHVNADADQSGLRVQLAGQTKLRVQGYGGVSIGANSTSSYAMHLQNSSDPLMGSAIAYEWLLYSDSRIKSDQQPLSYGLEEILRLKPKQYQHRSSEYFEDGASVMVGERTQPDLGMIAQEVFEIIPEIVHRPKNEHAELWSIDYIRLIPVLVKGIQELTSQVAHQGTLIEALEARLLALENP